MGLWDTVKRNNIHIMGILEGEVKEKGTEKISKAIIAENFPVQMQKAQKLPNSLTMRHIKIKLSKVKDKGRI